MSESTRTETTERKQFKIELEETITLPSVAQTAYLSSNEFCKLTSELFKEVFADFEGCTFEVGNGEPTMNLLFNHGKYDSNAIVACELAGGKSSGSSIIDRTRTRDRQMTEGDRYYLTEDGKDAFITLLTTKLYNNGNPNWKHIVSEWQDRSIVNYYNNGATPQYTKISGISLQRLCGLIFGTKDKETGERIEYDVKIAAPLSPTNYYVQNNGMNMDINYMLTITAVSAQEVAKIYEKLGFGVVGTRIVR